MNSRIHGFIRVAISAAILGTASLAAADGIAGRMADKAKAREQRSEQRSEPQRSQPSRSEPARSEPKQPRNESSGRARSEQPARQQQPTRQAPQPARQAQQQQPPRQAQPARHQQPTRQEPARAESSSSGVLRELQARRQAEADRIAGRVESSRTAPKPAPNTQAPAAPQPSAGASGGNRGNANGGNRGNNGGNRGNANGGNRGNDRDNDRGVLGTLVRDQADRNGRDWDRDTNSNRDRYDRRDAWRDRDRDRDRRHRHVHVINYLPAGYHSHLWNDTHYYYHGGYWYRPYGSSYITVGIPYGLFVTTLPGSFTSVYVGGTRYYYSDYHYYTYEPARRGYVVVRSPYDDDYDYEADTAQLGDDLYVYPAQGQSEQQQADDRYECHRWAVSETNYDPIEDDYDENLRADYLRALTACLTGRGYTVR